MRVSGSDSNGSVEPNYHRGFGPSHLKIDISFTMTIAFSMPVNQGCFCFLHLFGTSFVYSSKYVILKYYMWNSNFQTFQLHKLKATIFISRTF